MAKSRDSNDFRLTIKDCLLTVAGTGLALGSLKADDPVVVLPMLFFSCAAFVVLCIFQPGSRFKRTLVAILICVVIIFIGWRDLNNPARSAYVVSLALALMNGVTKVLDDQKVRYILCIISGMILITLLRPAARWVKASPKGRGPQIEGKKGFLDYKMQAETGMSSLGPILDEITQITSNVGSSIELHSEKVKGALRLSASAQVKVVRQAARMLDRYSIQFDKKCDVLEKIGASLAEGLEGWLKWMSSQPNQAGAKEFQAPLRSLLESMESAIASIDGYLAQLEATHGISRDWNLALEKHLISMRRIRDANTRIWTSGSEGLRHLEAIQTSAITDEATP